MKHRARALAVILIAGLNLAACQERPAPPVPRRIVDLSPLITPNLNIRRLGSRALGFLNSDGRTEFTPVLPENPAFAYGLHAINLLSHTGAHLDAPARLLRGGEAPGRVNLHRLFGRARIVDLRWHDRHSPIQIAHLEISQIDEDDIVILFLGYEPPTGAQWPQFAPLAVQASEWLAARRIRALATDLPAIARYDLIEDRLRKGQPPEQVWAEYLPLFQAQIPIILGLVNVDAIVREPNVAFVGFPLPLAAGSGAPVRAAALVY